MDIDHAVAAHAEWKIRLREAIATDATLDAATVGADNCCELGKWLYGDARRLNLDQAVLSDVVTKHAAFHREAGRVAAAINAKKMAEAEAMLRAGTAYAEASGEVSVALNQLKRAIHV